MTKLTAIIELNRFQRDLVYDFELGTECDWVHQLLLELNESSGVEEEEFLSNSELKIAGTLKRVNVPEFQDVTILTYKFHAKYLAMSVDDLKLMDQTLEYESSLCFLHDSYENDEAYKEETEIFIENQMRELYFCKKGKAHLAEAIHEQTFLNFNFYPKNLEEDS